MESIRLRDVALGVAIGAGAALLLGGGREAPPRAAAPAVEEPAARAPAATPASGPSPAKASTTKSDISPAFVGEHRNMTIPGIISLAEQTFPSKVATISAEGTQRTYAEFAQRVKRFATGLVEKTKASPGDRVAVIALNSEHYLELYFSVSYAGMLIVPCNIRLSAAELAQALNDCQCKVLVIDETFQALTPDLRKLVPSITHVILAARPGSALTPVSPDMINYEALVASSEPRHLPHPAQSDDVYGLFYTGGTTGRSKGVMLSHSGLILNAYSIMNHVRYAPGVRYLHAGPMFHLADGANTFGVTMAGGTHCFVPKFVPLDCLRSISEFKVTHTMLVPTMFQLLLATPTLKDFDLRSVRHFVYGASPMPEKVLVEVMRAFPGAKFSQGYGMTETSPLLTLLGPEHHYPGSPYLLSVGQSIPHGVVKIVDENDNELPLGQVGEIVAKGPHVMLGYWNMPETTAAALRGGYMHTGDGGRMDANGFIFIQDRLKDMIVTGGENVYSSEVENAVLSCAGVLAVAVIGIPDAKLVEQVCAICVVAKDSPLTEADVITHVKSLIAGYKTPKKVIFRHDPLPLSGAGKVLKTELRKPFWEGTGAHIYKTTGEDKGTAYDNASGR